MEQKIKILIADDNKAISTALRLKLNSDGIEVKAVFNGKDALNLLEKEKFDLLILDLIMPELDGFEVLKSLRERGLKMPVIVDSDLSQAEDIKKVKELGAVDFLVKSDLSVDQIVEKIKTYIKPAN
jgi:DNA-binding response OmpR family regulator